MCSEAATNVLALVFVGDQSLGATPVTVPWVPLGPATETAMAAPPARAPAFMAGGRHGQGAGNPFVSCPQGAQRRQHPVAVGVGLGLLDVASLTAE